MAIHITALAGCPGALVLLELGHLESQQGLGAQCWHIPLMWELGLAE